MLCADAVETIENVFGTDSRGQDVLLDDLDCDGSERDLLECNRRNDYGLGYTNCGFPRELAGVKCQG